MMMKGWLVGWSMMGLKVNWFERVFALVCIPLVCWSKPNRDSLWRLFRYGVVEGELAKKVKG